MSGLVNGLQNRLRRFESARHLERKKSFSYGKDFFFLIGTGVEKQQAGKPYHFSLIYVKRTTKRKFFFIFFDILFANSKF